ncbi:MAG: immunoglobulin domain-containing protein [Bryobacterales bacterium]|nr:immunoglobulin domain-containing protein [Bryobacterales bacterium]
MSLRYAALLAVPALAFGAVIVDDLFSDGDSRNQNLPQSLRLFNGRANTVRSHDAGSVQFDLTNAGGSDAFWAFFTEAGAPVRLEVGDKITVSVAFHLSGFPANAQDIRFGVFDSLGTRNTADLTGGMNNATFIDDPGYGMQFFASGAGSAFALGRRANLTGGNIFNSFGDFTALSSIAPVPPRQTLRGDTVYTLHYNVLRLSEGENLVNVRVEGDGVSGLDFSGFDTGSDLPTSFDYFAFRVTGPAFAQRITLSRIQVAFTPAAPVITTQPQPSSLTVRVGARVVLAVGARGNELSYQWYRDATPLLDRQQNPSVGLPTLQLENISLADAGSYTVRVSNGGGTVTSTPVVLRVSRDPVAPPPAITQQPLPLTAAAGEPATFTVAATGAGLTYQWFKDGAPLPGATASSFTIARAQLTDQGQYTVLITNGSGRVTSEAARLTLVSAMSVVTATPVNGATGICVDPPLLLTFDRPVRAGRGGRIRLFRSDGVVADTIDLRAANHVRLIGSGNTPFQYDPLLVDGNTARLVFPRARLTPGETYSLEIEQGALTDEAGVSYRGRLADRWTFTVRTTAPVPGATSLVVDPEGDGDFCTVQSAIDHVPVNNIRRTVIQVKPGIYPEQVYVGSGKNHITVRSDSGETEIRYANNANRNPSQRQVFSVDASDFTLENITVRNTTAKGGSQAEAFRGNGQRIALNFVKLYSFQDTLWLQGQAFVNNSYIEGDVDFTWGNGGVFFTDTELKMVTGGGYYTQIRNGRGQVGNVYVRCRFTAAPGVTNAYLSRIDPNIFPYSQMILIDSVLGAHIRPEAWLLNNAGTAQNVQFWEYNSRDEQGNLLTGLGRAPFSRQLTAEDAERWREASVVFPLWRPSTKLVAGIEIPELDRLYNGQAQTLSPITTPPGLPVRVVYARGGPPPTEAGTYPVMALVEDATYQGTLRTTLTIRPAAVDITLRDLYQTFDGTPKPVRVLTDPPTAGVTVTYNGSPVAPVQPGRYAVLASFGDRNRIGRASATLTIAESNATSLASFPGAEGEGAQSRGGRGGDVYHVTNLEDSGPGSLRNGIQTATGPRTIVFDVGGTIQLRSRLSINRSFLTIAGQTAPGDGITVAGWPAVISGASHVILRYLRFRMGDRNCPAVQDDALWVDRSSNVIIDHVSASWSVDETLSVTDSTRVTVQWSFITESLRNSCHEKGAHGYGSLIRFGNGLVSYHHNLFAHHDSRNPRVGDDIGLDFVNNMVYNWGSTAGYSGSNDEGNTRVNFAANVFKAGPSSGSGTNRNRAFSGGGTNTAVYQENNIMNGSASGWLMFTGALTRRDTGRFDLAQVELMTANEAYEAVLAQGGASLRRDAVDLRVIEEVRTGRGRLIDSQDQVGGWPVLQTGTAPADRDGDGMPDAWEFAQGLNSADAADGNRVGSDGYTNLERYLHSLVVQ